ncbi:hypothetical protein LPJ59_003551 [Coemansia sp. RSA 2399]|nr:hypothetical protein LPJ59_003551 [Coemansia sp. RSA 2399]KAJ1903224.1 hypothetical protein LPJ81_003169 [Coemansia sp. IMI 209127]
MPDNDPICRPGRFSLRRCNRIAFIVLVVLLVLLLATLTSPPNARGGPPQPQYPPPPRPYDKPGSSMPQSWLNENRSRLQSWFSRPDYYRCADLPIPPEYWTLEEETAPAFVDIPRTKAIEVGETVCVRVVIPAQPSHASVLYTPFPDMGWDSVMLDLVGNDTGISVPVQLRPSPDFRNTRRDSVHVYEADVLLRDVDLYRPQGLIEYRSAEWNPEDGLPIVMYDPEPLLISDLLEIEVADEFGRSPYSLARHMELPLCTELSPEGRWVAAADVPFDTEGLPSPDPQGRIWMPYSCRLQRYSYAGFAQCLLKKYPLMHFYGDSNTRRMLKKVTTLGEWCSAPESFATHPCMCEDHEEKFDRFNVDHHEILIDIDPINGGRTPSRVNLTAAIPPPDKSRIYFRRWGGLTARNPMPWPRSFEAGVQHYFGTPQVVLLSLTNWDSAFSTRTFFARQLDSLITHMQSSYGPDIEIILRTGQYYCCRTDLTRAKRQYTRMRNQGFDKYIVDVFRERLGPTRNVSVWDVASLMENQPFEARNALPFCDSNHARSEILEIENQVLFNHMCN